LNQKALTEFASKIAIATLEFENIPVFAVDFVNKIKPVFPKGKILEITQNRLKEKDFIRKNGISVTNFTKINNLEELEVNLSKFGGKAILKTATLGYDGKGQYVLDKNSNLAKIWQENVKNEMILEEFVAFDSEISVMVARNLRNEIVCYDPLTNIHKNGILDISIYPAKISEKCKNDAQEISVKIAQALDLQGVLAVEFFVMPNDKLLVNELAPRPHNSGHFSMDAAVTSQFEQLIRAITGLPLGSCTFHSSGYMKNLIGDEVKNLAEFYKNPMAKVHLYGKDKVAVGRKMGHVNVLN
jgi:5-(carboxyamino)imidazole ribonucleotide synthase